MTIDNLLAAEVVTADGEILMASEPDNRDLFWAIRGGGGNFGIATRFHFRLHEAPTIVGGGLVYQATREVIRDYVENAAAAPDALATITSSMLAPPLPFIPAEAHGTPVFMIIACYAGDLNSSKPAYAPFRNLGGSTPLADMIEEMPFPALYELTQMAGKRRPQAVRAAFMNAIDGRAIEAIIDAISHPSSSSSTVVLRVLGGEIARVPADATAFSHRDKPIYFAINNSWDDPDDPRNDEHVAWTESLWQSLAPHTAGAYANFLGDEGVERARSAYSPEALARLARLKQRFDPDNIFRANVNIPPA
jgi:FAD/FMN-containing dehydrogenase